MFGIFNKKKGLLLASSHRDINGNFDYDTHHWSEIPFKFFSKDHAENVIQVMDRLSYADAKELEIQPLNA